MNGTAPTTSTQNESKQLAGCRESVWVHQYNCDETTEWLGRGADARQPHSNLETSVEHEKLKIFTFTHYHDAVNVNASKWLFPSAREIRGVLTKIGRLNENSMQLE